MDRILEKKKWKFKKVTEAIGMKIHVKKKIK